MVKYIWGNSKAVAKASFCIKCLLDKKRCLCKKPELEPKPEKALKSVSRPESNISVFPKSNLSRITVKCPPKMSVMGRLKRMTNMAEIFIGQKVYYTPKSSVTQIPEEYRVYKLSNRNSIIITQGNCSQVVALFELQRID